MRLPGYPPSVGQQADFSEVGAVTERGGHVAVLHHDVHDALLYEVHLGADGSLLYGDYNLKYFYILYLILWNILQQTIRDYKFP